MVTVVDVSEVVVDAVVDALGHVVAVAAAVQAKPLAALPRTRNCAVAKRRRVEACKRASAPRYTA